MKITEKHKKDWEVKYEHKLTDEDYKQICSNLDEFLTLLKKWNKNKENKNAHNN